MDSINRLAELWDRRRVLCVCMGAILLGAWAGAHRWLPDGFGAEQFQRTSAIPIVGPVSWNARLRFIAGEKEQYLGSMPHDPDGGDLYVPNTLDYHASFSGGSASLAFRIFGSEEGIEGAGKSPILTLACPQMDKFASGAEDGSIVIWQDLRFRYAIARLMPLATLRTPKPVTALALSEDAKTLASGSSDGVIRLWDLSSKPRLLREIQDQKQTVYGLAFSRDGSELWSGGFDGVVRARKVDGDGPAMEKARHGAPIYGLERIGPEIVGIGLYGIDIDRHGATGLPGYYKRDLFPMYRFFPGDDWVGGISPGQRRISLSPDRRLVAVVDAGNRLRYLSIWELGQFSFPFGLRYRGAVPEDYLGNEVRWSQDSTALCLQSSKDSSCQWVEAVTGRASNGTANRAIAPSIFARTTIKPRVRIQGDGTALDYLMGRKMIAEAQSNVLTVDMIVFGYVTPRFPLVPIELFALPLLAGALAFLLRRSPYWNRKRSLAPATVTLQTFFAASGAETSAERLGLLRVGRLDPPLAPYSPMPAVVAIGPVDESHVDLLVQEMKRLHGENQRAAGFLFYLEPPSAVALLRMAEARLNQLAVIPMPLATVERVKESPSEARALLNEYADRYLPGRNLFDDRNAISDAVAFFGRGSLLAKLEQELLNYQSVGLWGLRKAGKTSILLQLEQILRNRAVVRIGLEPFTVQAPFGNQIFNEILRQLRATLRRMGKEASCPEFPVNAPARDSAIEFRGSVEDLAARLGAAGVPLPIVCMLDEMERVLPKDAASAEEFNVTFGGLRNLCQDKRVMSLLVTDLFADSSRTNQWPVAGASTNPLFNFLKSVYAGPFEEADTVQMIDSLGKLMNFQFEPGELAEIHELSGGHAFLARQVAAMLYDLREGGAGRERLLANPIRFSDTLRSYFPENVWSPLEARGDTAALAILAVLADANGWMACPELQARCPQPKTAFWSAIEWLAQTGIIARRAGGGAEESYRIRMGMFAQWFQQSEVSVRKNV